MRSSLIIVIISSPRRFAPIKTTTPGLSHRLVLHQQVGCWNRDIVGGQHMPLRSGSDIGPYIVVVVARARIVQTLSSSPQPAQATHRAHAARARTRARLTRAPGSARARAHARIAQSYYRAAGHASLSSHSALSQRTIGSLDNQPFNQLSIIITIISSGHPVWWLTIRLATAIVQPEINLQVAKRSVIIGLLVI